MTSVLDTLRGNGVDDLLPADLADRLSDLGITDTSVSHPSPDVTVIRGTVMPIAGRGLPALGGAPFEAPGLTSGLRVQIAVRTNGGGSVTDWAVDLDLDRVSLVVPGLRPAREVRQPARATRLADEPTRSQVRIVGRGVLRVAATGGATPDTSLIDALDDQAPFGPHGPVVTLGFEPPSFFLDGSSFGFTVDELTYDQSTSTSPTPKPAAWRGLALRRATFYLPPGAPLLGDVSVGVENVFLGDPVGVEGTATLEFGGASDTPLALVVEQEVGGTWQALAVTAIAEPGTRGDRVTAALQGAQPPAARVRARLTTSPAGVVTWRLPRGQADPTGFDVLPGDVVEVRLDAQAPSVCVFTGTWTAPPTIDLAIGGATWTNVTSVSGTEADLAAASFAHSSGPGGPFAWRWDGGSDAVTAPTGPPTGTQARTHVLTLRSGGRDVRRVIVEVRARGPVLVGCALGTFTLSGGTSTPVAVIDVSGTYRLVEWHGSGTLARALPSATASGGSVAVGQGELAEVVTEAVASGPPSTLPPPRPVETHAHVRYVYDSTEPRPAGSFWAGDQQLDMGTLQAWVESLGPSAGFAVVGRCDDLNGSIPLTDVSDTYNQALAVRRAERTVDVLTGVGVAASRIAARGEQSSWFTAPPPASAVLPAEATTVGWLARSTTTYRAWGRHYPDDDGHRAPLRRGDIYAYDVTPTPSAVPPAQDGATLDAARLRALVPGADPTVVSGAVVPPVPHARPQYRVRIEVEWNDPAARGLADSWPIRAEALIQWQGDTVPLPPGSGSAALTQPGTTSTTTPVWTLRGRWAHDRTAGTDEFLLSIDVAGDPTGIAVLTSRPLAAALGLAPAVVGAASGGGGTVSGEDAALVGALITAIGAAATVILRDGSRTIVTGVTIEHLHREQAGTGRTRLTVDYTVELSVDVAGLGLPLHVSTRVGKPMKLRYRGVGVEIDTGAATWWEGVGLHARDAMPEVVDPGSWQLGPPLDDLLRVTGVRSGAQSSWLEVDLALSLDLGVVKLSNATVRVVFGSTGITGLELRGLRAAVDIPATLRGEGAVDVSGGSIHAGVQLEVIPLKIGAIADLQLGEAGFAALLVGVRFPAPIPFANSGLGLFGVAGRFVSNGTRKIDPGPDPVGRELAWLERADKYRGEVGQYALGFGAVVGTVPDLGFTFHAFGMVTVEFPRPTVVFAVIAKILSDTAPVPTDQATRPAYGLSIVGLIVIDSDAVTIALRGHYAIPGILELDIPVGAYFPYANPTSSWVHLGTDGQPGREGARVTLTLLPDVLDVRVWAFVMVHGNGLTPGLDGNADFVFSGFAVGFGAGWEIDWSAGPIRLFASAKVLAGFGTNPLFLAAGIWVRGELDLVVVSISARGEITLKTDGNRTDLHGEFCGEVDCFFFSIEGCVSIDVSATLGALPDPASPVAGVDLVSRLGHATAKAVAGGSGGPTVWPDTIPVIHFAHTVENGIAGGDFTIGTAMPGPVWSGSRDVQHAFRLTGVRLEPTSGPALTPPAGGFPTAWWWPGIRSSVKPPWLSASESEPRDLALLSWEPWTGLLPLTQPGGSPGDPGPLIDELCEPVSRPDGVCLVGELAAPAGAGRASLPEDPSRADPALAPAHLTLEQPADRPWATLVAAAISAGVAIRPAGISPLDAPWALDDGITRSSGWRLASLVRGGQELGAIGAIGRYDPQLEEPALVLEVCPVRVVDKEGSGGPAIGCTTFEDLDRDAVAQAVEQNGTVLRHAGVVVTSLGGGPIQAVDFDGDGRWALLLTAGGLGIDLAAPVDEVRLRTVTGQEWKVAAFDANGSVVADGHGQGSGTATLRGDGIVRLEVFGEGEGGLSEVCSPGLDAAGEAGHLLGWQPGNDDRVLPPDVVGILPDGREEPWKPSVKGGRHCLTIVYRAPAAGPWAGVRIASAPGRRVTVVGSCGLRWYQALERREAEAARLDALGVLTAFATGAEGALRATVDAPLGVTGEISLPVLYVAGPPPRPLLSAATGYRLTVDWQWQRWERSSSSPSPGAPDPGAWQNGTPSTFAFGTAALAAPSSPPPPVDLIGETTFDPRGLARYVTGAAPSGPLPHLLDDPIRVTFSVDYVAALLDRYAHDVRVEVRPTDVPAASVPEGLHPPDLVTKVSLKAWLEDDVLLPVELAVVDAVAAAPCVPPTNLGGTAAEVLAALEPERAYDLVLVAHPRSAGADVVIRRWHFRTSRYRDVDGILAALGLTTGTPNAVTPDDVLLDRQWPVLPAGGPGDDAAFDASLAALGVDPWPLSTRPRTTTIWVPPDPGSGRTAWALAAVLLEAPEPIARTGRVTVTAAVGATPLAVARSTANGTRALLVAATPVVPAPADALTVTLSDGLRSRSATGGAALLGGPRTVRRELA